MGIEPARLIVQPIDAPALRVRIEQAKGKSNKIRSPAGRDKVIIVAYAPGQGLIALGGTEGFPFLAILQAPRESLILHVPVPDKKVKIIDAVQTLLLLKLMHFSSSIAVVAMIGSAAR